MYAFAEPNTAADVHDVPSHNNEVELCGVKVVPPTWKAFVPMFVTYNNRPIAAFVGLGSTIDTPVLVWLIARVVAASTVAAAVPMLLVAVVIFTAANKVAAAFVNKLPVVTVKPPLAVSRPLEVKAPAFVVVMPLLPMVIAVAVVVPILSVPALGVSNKGACRLMAALPVPLIQKLEVA